MIKIIMRFTPDICGLYEVKGKDKEVPVYPDTPVGHEKLERKFRKQAEVRAYWQGICDARDYARNTNKEATI